MNNETKLTAADLALYMGCEVLDEYGELSMLAGVIRDETVKIRNLKTGAFIFVFSKSVKPILRPLSDMTEEEENATQAFVNEIGFGYELGASITRYLLSRHFDLFGWIDAGLAIDKTKTTQP